MLQDFFHTFHYPTIILFDMCILENYKSEHLDEWRQEFFWNVMTYDADEKKCNHKQSPSQV